MQLGFSERSSVVRMAQYESGIRTPKKQMTEDLAGILEVDPAARTVPDIDSYNGLMHTLFVLEERYGLMIDKMDNDFVIRLDKSDMEKFMMLYDRLSTWYEQSHKYRTGEISKEEYDTWRYSYPKYAAYPRLEIPKPNKK